MRKTKIAAMLFFAAIMAIPHSSNAGSVPFDSITRALIAVKTITDTIIDGSNNVNNAIPTGAIVFYKTKTGHLGKLKVLFYGYNMWLRIVTYNSDGSVFAHADSVQIGGTCFCDLDSAKQSTSLLTDFQWEQVTDTLRNIKAKNPAKLSLYYSPNNVVTNISIATPSPSIINVNQVVSIKFTYKTSMANGAKIFCKPISAGPGGPITLPSAHYSLLTVASAGTDTASGYFFFDTGFVSVNSVYFLMLDSSRTRTLFESSMSVSYAVAPDTAQNLAIPISFSPPSPATLADTQRVTAGFLFRANEPTGVRIVCMPITKGSLSFGAVWQGSSVIYSPTGTFTRFFSVLSGAPRVDSIWVLMMDSANVKTLFQAYLPVLYQFTVPTSVVAKVNNAPPRGYVCSAGRDGTIRIKIPEAGFAEIKVYDARGRCLGIVVRGYMTVGEHVKKMGNVRGVAMVRVKVNGKEYVHKVIAGE